LVAQNALIRGVFKKNGTSTAHEKDKQINKDKEAKYSTVSQKATNSK
jgi:hypothetical protein